MIELEEKKQNPKLGISIGDVNGIGPEVVMKALMDQRITKLFTPVIYACDKVISFYRKQLDLEFHFSQTSNINQTNDKKTNVINVWNEEVELKPGEANSDGGKYAILSLKAAVEDLKQGKIDALVTAPINKDLMKGEGFEFPGHTEFFAHRLKAPDVHMMFAGPSMRVVLATVHVALADVLVLKFL